MFSIRACRTPATCLEGARSVLLVCPWRIRSGACNKFSGVLAACPRGIRSMFSMIRISKELAVKFGEDLQGEWEFREVTGAAVPGIWRVRESGSFFFGRQSAGEGR